MYIIIERVDTDVPSESTVEPVFESKLLKPCSDDGDCFTNSKVVSAVDPVVFQEVCRV